MIKERGTVCNHTHERLLLKQKIGKNLTFDLDAFEAHGYAERIFYATAHLLVVVGSRHVENLVIESILSSDFSIVDEPLVASLVDRGVGHCVAMESRLGKKVFVKLG